MHGCRRKKSLDSLLNCNLQVRLYQLRLYNASHQDKFELNPFNPVSIVPVPMPPERRSACPIACALDLIGDRWTLLIIRDMLFFNKQRFEEFLESPEGISTNILTNRLKMLEEFGLVEKHRYSSHSRRMNYSLTDYGRSLRPVLKAMLAWGTKYIPETQTMPPASTDQPMLDQIVPNAGEIVEK